ncbi:unnamed protein product [Rhizophagus irregularis]|nr:unnamed protein product [Rhizophagus irregularis]
MNNDKEPYSGYHALVSYIKDNTQCSYTEFLNLNRNVILSSQPFSKKWNVLDLTWTRRFLKQVKEVREYDYATIEKKVKKQCANQGLKICWETIIYEREKVSASYLYVLKFFVLSFWRISREQ